MNAFTFKRGIHPDDHKRHTDTKPIEVILPKAGQELIFPMSQHIGAACKPIVEIGQRVLVGEKIGEAPSRVSSPVHSSVSGVVRDIRQALTPTGIFTQSVVVETDALMEELPALKPKYAALMPNKNELLDIIKEAGIVGLGGAGFPTHVKLSPPPEHTIDTVIVNASECEPYLTTDHRVLLEEADRLVEGLNIILSLFPEAKGIIAVELNKADAIGGLTKAIAGGSRISLKRLLPKYPQGSEKHLIYACTGREVPVGALPASVGCIVNNVDTVIAVHRAVRRGRPLMRKVVTVTGGAAANPGNYKVRLGMKFSDLMDAVGGFIEEPRLIVCGGPMMGVAMFTLDVPVIKTSSALLCLTEAETAPMPEKPCIRCGKCVDHCPMGLMPLVISQNASDDDRAAFKKNHGPDCIECGCCSYVCPAKRHLAQSIKTMKRG